MEAKTQCMSVWCPGAAATLRCVPLCFVVPLAPTVSPLTSSRLISSQVAHSVSRKTREVILERAKVLDIKVTNAAARMTTEENE